MYVFTLDTQTAGNWEKKKGFADFEWLKNDYELYATEEELIYDIKNNLPDVFCFNHPEAIVYVAEIDDITNKILKISQYLISIQIEKMKDTLLFRNWRCKK